MEKENPLEEIASLFGKDGLAHNDLARLSVSLESLTTTLKKRAGIADQKPEYTQPKRTLKSDKEDFIAGLLLKRKKEDAKEYFGFGEKPTNVEKAKADSDPSWRTKEDFIEKEKIDKVTAEEPPVDMKNMEVEKAPVDTKNVETIDAQVKSKEDKKELPAESPEQNKILSDMVEVLIDMRDDRSQKEMLKEVSEIKSIINNQNKKTELAGGVEPNNEEAKQEDREKLAEAIATKLADILEEQGIGSNSGFDLPDRGRGKGRKPTTKPPIPGGAAAAEGVAAAEGAAAAGSAVAAGATVGTVLAGGVAASVGATNVLQSMSKEQREQLSNDVGSDTGIAAAVLNEGDKLPEEIAKEERDNKLLEKAPWYTRMYGIGKSDFLKNPTTIEGASAEEASNARTNFARTDPRRIDVAPKETQVKLGNMLAEADKENTTLKMFTEPQNTQMIAPIVTNKTINNTEQTIMAPPPIPHSNYSGLQNFQKKVSNYY
jgi:hypothetical protein